jgi:hypothetical protein
MTAASDLNDHDSMTGVDVDMSLTAKNWQAPCSGLEKAAPPHHRMLALALRATPTAQVGDSFGTARNPKQDAMVCTGYRTANCNLG